MRVNWVQAWKRMCIYIAEPELKAQLDALENELRFVLITSAAEMHLANSHLAGIVQTEVPGLGLKVTAVDASKV